ncbi:hypothetical protein BJX63DRAFT_385416 [Aspergillus granulosus]|uniref:Uncharacterized protein n=1 Tax=Aspergillus granulosus TaxID=176169 RepID=A0ABR4HQ06_9EURO
MLSHLPLRRNRIGSMLHIHARTARTPYMMAAFSTRPAHLSTGSSSKNTQGNKKGPELEYWKYDTGFRASMQRIVGIGILVAIGSLGWYRDIKSWWKGTVDEGDELR